MKICIINPNTSSAMTNNIKSSAVSVVSDEVEINCINPGDGPESIEGYYDEVFGSVGVVKALKDTTNADGYIIACFDDTGLDAARSMTDRPVIGIGEAAFHVASLVSEYFTVITTLERSVNAIRNNLLRYGLGGRCVNVIASEIPVLELETNSIKSKKIISELITRTKREDSAGAIVLGCAGMGDFAQELSESNSLPVVDGVKAAVCLVESLIKLNLKTSRLGGYQPPLKKKYAGSMSNFAPK